MPSLVGRRPSLLGWGAIALRLEAIASRVEAIASSRRTFNRTLGSGGTLESSRSLNFLFACYHVEPIRWLIKAPQRITPSKINWVVMFNQTKKTGHECTKVHEFHAQCVWNAKLALVCFWRLFVWIAGFSIDRSRLVDDRVLLGFSQNCPVWICICCRLWLAMSHPGLWPLYLGFLLKEAFYEWL